MTGEATGVDAGRYRVVHPDGRELGKMTVSGVLCWVEAPFAYRFDRVTAEALAERHGGVAQTTEVSDE